MSLSRIVKHIFWIFTDNIFMLVTFIRTFIVFITLVIIMRLMGKRQIGEMQPFEFIITLLIAELVCIPMTDVSIPLSYGIVSVIAVFILHQIMSILESLGDKIKFIISGKPSVVITPNGVVLEELKKNNLGVSDLIEALRSLGYFSFDEVDYAIFESNGKLSALKSKNDSNQTLPLLLIGDGKIQKNNFLVRQVTLNELNEKLDNKLKKIKNVEVLTMDEKGRIYLKMRGKKFEILQYKRGVNEC